MGPWGWRAPRDKPLGLGESQAQCRPDHASSRGLGGRAGQPELPGQSSQGLRRNHTQRWEVQPAPSLPRASCSRHHGAGRGVGGLRDVPLCTRHPDSGSEHSHRLSSGVLGPLVVLPGISLTPPSIPRSLQKSSQGDRRDTSQDAGFQFHLSTGEVGGGPQPETLVTPRPGGRRRWRAPEGRFPTGSADIGICTLEPAGPE